jgi:hypothetical protein
MIDAFFGVLDEKAPLNIYDPGLTLNLGENTTAEQQSNPLDNLRPTSILPASELDTRTSKVRQLLKHAMYECFYKRYHPRQAYRNKVTRTAQRKDYHFSYLIDMQAMFHPALSNGRLLHRIIFSFQDATREEKERHYGLLTDYIWQTITSLAE